MVAIVLKTLLLLFTLAVVGLIVFVLAKSGSNRSRMEERWEEQDVHKR